MIVKGAPVFHIIIIMAAGVKALVRAQYCYIFKFPNNEMA